MGGEVFWYEEIFCMILRLLKVIIKNSQQTRLVFENIKTERLKRVT